MSPIDPKSHPGSRSRALEPSTLFCVTAADEPERLRLSVEVRTRYTTDEQGRMQWLTQDQWLKRQRQLQALGGPCDVRRWEDLSEAELAQLRSP